MKTVMIVSPYSGNIAYNTYIAQALCKKAIDLGYAPFAPHLLYPQMLDENLASDRDAGIQCGLAFLDVCDLVWVLAGPISKGMQLEIDYARSINKPVLEVTLCK